MYLVWLQLDFLKFLFTKRVWKTFSIIGLGNGIFLEQHILLSCKDYGHNSPLQSSVKHTVLLRNKFCLCVKWEIADKILKMLVLRCLRVHLLTVTHGFFFIWVCLMSDFSVRVLMAGKF